MVYPTERKAAILVKLLPPSSRPVSEVALEEGMNEGTLYNWRHQALKNGSPVSTSEKKLNKWSAQAKFVAVVETANLSATELSQYCREKGLYPEEVSEWKQASIQGVGQESAANKTHKAEIQGCKKQIKQLERELAYKDKALAETAALLVLRKKLQALWGTEEEDA
jgi:transposase